MKLGLLTAPFPDTDLMAVADWASGAGLSALEIACWPAGGGEERRYAGTSHINVDGLTKEQGVDILAELTEMGNEVSGLGYYPNPLHPDAAQRDDANCRQALLTFPQQAFGMHLLGYIRACAPISFK